MPQSALLRALHPGPLHIEQRLQCDGNVIGRDGHNVDIVLHGPRVSRRHCWVGLDQTGEWLLKDMSSTNGVFVNGQRIQGEQKLAKHDVIGLGRSRTADYEFLADEHDEALRTRALEGKGPWLIGRDLSADLSLPADPVVSLRHARLQAQPEGLLLEDLGSRNGTWVDGKRIRRTRLAANQTIVIGNNELELQRPDQKKPVFAVRTTRRAVGLSATGLAVTPDASQGVDFAIPPGGLQVLDSKTIGSAEDLIAVISGQRRPLTGQIEFSEPSLDDHHEHRRDRVGVTLNDAEPGPQQTMLDWMLDQARLALAGDLSANRLQELVVTTLEAMNLAELGKRQDAALSPLHRCLFRVAAALLTRPSLLLINPNIVDELDPDSVDVLADRLRKLASSALTIVMVTGNPPARLEPGESIEIKPVERPVAMTRNFTATLAPRRVSTTVTSILLRLCLGPWRQLSGTLPEALVLPLILLPGLWYALPGHPPILAALLTVTIGAALATATLVSRAHSRLLPLARRHLLLGDVMLALLLLGTIMAVAQLGIVLVTLTVTAAISLPSVMTVLPALVLAALSSVALGMLCGVLAGPRVLLAVLLAAALTFVQVMVVGWMEAPDTAGLVTRRLADLSGAFWGLTLYQHSAAAAGLGETLRPLAFLAGQLLLFLAFARAALRRRIQAA